MGQEFAQLREWSEARELDWFLLAEDEHVQIQNWVRDLRIFINATRRCMNRIILGMALNG